MSEPNEQPDFEPSELSAEAGIVCTVCVMPNSPHANYCAECGAPLNTLVAFNPFDQTLVEGFAYRRAVDGPPSKIVLLGIWLLFAPSLFNLFLFSTTLPRETSPRGMNYSGEQIYFYLYSLISLTILYRATSNYLSKRKKYALVKPFHLPPDADPIIDPGEPP